MASLTADLVASDAWAYHRDDEAGSWTALVAAVRWWPDTELQVAQPLPGYFELRVALRTPDTREPLSTVRIGHRFPLPEHVHRAGPVAMQRHIRNCLKQVAIHEADEWILIGRVRPYDPHGAGASGG